MHCCLWFRSVFRVRGPWPKRYGYHLSIIYMVVFASLSTLGENIAHPHLSFRSPLFYLRERSTVSKGIYLQNFVVTTTIHATAFDLS